MLPNGGLVYAWSTRGPHPDTLVWSLLEPQPGGVDVLDNTGRRVRELVIEPQQPTVFPRLVCDCSGKILTYLAVSMSPAALGRPVDRKNLLLRLRIKSWRIPGFESLADDCIDLPAQGFPMLGTPHFNSDGDKIAIPLTEIAGPTEARSVTLLGQLVIWDVQRGRQVFISRADCSLRAAGFDRDGRPVAVGGQLGEGRVLIWNPGDGSVALSLRGHSKPILGFSFHQNGRLATGGADGAVKVWDPGTGRELLALSGDPCPMGHVAFTPDGQSLVAATTVDLLEYFIGYMQDSRDFSHTRLVRSPAVVRVWSIRR